MNNDNLKHQMQPASSQESGQPTLKERSGNSTTTNGGPLKRISFRTGVCCLALFSCLVAPRSGAQPFAVDWSTVAGGGGTSTGAVYSVSGTIGQAAAGATMSGGSFSVAGGFWSGITAVQTPGGPFLSIRLTTTNTVVVFWPSPSANYELEQTTNVAATSWTTVVTIPDDDGTIKSIVVNPPDGNRFYRLRKP